MNICSYIRVFVIGGIVNLVSYSGHCQLTTSAMPPAQLVNNVLLGTGVTISNVSYSGSISAIARFNGTNSNIGLSDGIVMTTGTAMMNANGPQGPNNSGGTGIDNGVAGNALLGTLTPNSTHNAAVLQFDFIPASDTISFRFVFGSEEYPENVCDDVNDVFGLFVTGANPNGGTFNNKNIAVVPGTNIPISINTINDGQSGSCAVGGNNTQYYINNINGSSVQYDGFTTVIKAWTPVKCGEQYHLIIAIADGGDGIWDSGIFLEANSLTSQTPIEITHSLSQDLFNDPNIMAEGCVTTTVTLDRDANLSALPLTVPILLSGTALEGVDYSNIPNSITFPAGVQQIQFSFDAFQDGLAEGQESIILSFSLIDPCGNLSPTELELFINDVEPVAVQIQGAPIDCPGDSVVLTTNVSGGAPPYAFIWNTGDLAPSITVAPSATTTYNVEVTDACLNETALAAHEVVVPIFQPLSLNETPDITELCPYITANISANASGGSGNYTYQWSSNFNPDLGNTNTISVTPSATTTYTVVVTDHCGNSTTAYVLYTITSPPLELTMSPNVKICPGDSVQTSASLTGGYGQYFYFWPHSAETIPTVWVNPYITTFYDVIVSDECQTFTVTDSVQVEVVKPAAQFTITSQTVFNNLPIQFQNLSSGGISYEWDFGDNSTSTIVHPSNTYNDPGTYVVTLIATNELGCKDTIARPLGIEEEWYIYIPNTFTPDGNQFNTTFSASTVGIQTLGINIFNRWGEIVFMSNDLHFSWDGTYNGKFVNDGTYTYVVNFITNSERRKNLTGHINVLR